jgi:hypothetical protein
LHPYETSSKKDSKKSFEMVQEYSFISVPEQLGGRGGAEVHTCLLYALDVYTPV